MEFYFFFVLITIASPMRLGFAFGGIFLFVFFFAFLVDFSLTCVRLVGNFRSFFFCFRSPNLPVSLETARMQFDFLFFL